MTTKPLSSPKPFGVVQPPPTLGGGCTLRYDVELIPELGADFSAAAELLERLPLADDIDHGEDKTPDI